MAEDNNQTTGGAAGAASGEQQNQPQFSLQRIYVKDISFESPNSPAVFQQPFKPKVGLDLNTTSSQVGEGLYEVVIKVTAQVSHSETGNTSFLAEIEQAGLFRIANIEGEQLEHTLGAFCPNLLFPYARECIDNLVNRGGFPPLMLDPIDFAQLYRQNMAQQAAAQQAGEQKPN